MSKHHTSYNKYSEKKKEPEAVVEEKVVVEEPEKTPEEKTEKSPEVKAPEKGEVLWNIYIREKPYGDHVEKDGLDRFLASYVLAVNGNAVLPKGTRFDIYDVFVHEDGSVWYNSKFGYVMAKNKEGTEYIKAD